MALANTCSKCGKRRMNLLPSGICVLCILDTKTGLRTSTDKFLKACSHCGHYRAIAPTKDICENCDHIQRFLGECPMCDENVYTGTKHVQTNDWFYHDNCFVLFQRYQWALDNPLI